AVVVDDRLRIGVHPAGEPVAGPRTRSRVVLLTRPEPSLLVPGEPGDGTVRVRSKGWFPGHAVTTADQAGRQAELVHQCGEVRPGLFRPLPPGVLGQGGH